MANLNGFEPLIVNYLKTFVKLVCDLDRVKFRYICVQFDGFSYEAYDNGVVMKSNVICERSNYEETSCESKKE